MKYIDEKYNTCYNNKMIERAHYSDRVDDIRERWQNVTLDDARNQKPPIQFQETGLADKGAVGLAVLHPEVGVERDTDNAIALILPHLNGWEDHLYIRARVMQQLIAPEQKVIVFPDNSLGKSVMYFSDTDKKRLRSGDPGPQVEQQMAVLERMGIANIALTGYSKGANNALALAALGSDKIRITKVNADEAASKYRRNRAQLLSDFKDSGGKLGGAIDDSGIPALSSLKGKVNRGVGLFMLKMFSPEGYNLSGPLTGSVDDMVKDAALQVGPSNMKLGYVEGSKLFDPKSITTSVGNGGLRLYEYTKDGGYTRKHATGDNVIAHATMVYDGLAID